MRRRDKVDDTAKGGRGFPLSLFLALAPLFILASACAVNLGDWNAREEGSIGEDSSGDGDGQEGDGAAIDECRAPDFAPPLLSPEKNLENLVPIEGALKLGEVKAEVLETDKGVWLADLKKGDYTFSVGSKDEGDEFYQLALYGPRGEQGRFGEAIIIKPNLECKKEIKIEAHISEGGIYLLYLREANGKTDTDYYVGLHCKERGMCEAPVCSFDPCGLVCQNGFAYDENSCVLCACKYICFSDIDCPAGFYCIDGKCREAPPACPDQYAPVCGADGKTYANSCEAEKSGVEVEREGICGSACVTNSDCPPQTRCEGGLCQPNSTGGGFDCSTCTKEEWEPFCTLEEGTVPNKCFVECKQLTVLYKGECEAEILDGGTAAQNGCERCQNIYDPVCGADNVTYGNPCTAECLDVEVSYKGECKDIPCGGKNNIPCPEGMECALGASGGEGICVSRKNP